MRKTSLLPRCRRLRVRRAHPCSAPLMPEDSPTGAATCTVCLFGSFTNITAMTLLLPFSCRSTWRSWA